MGFVVPRVFLVLLLLFINLPLHLLSTFLRILHGCRTGRVRMRLWTLLLVSIPIVFLSVFAFSGVVPPPSLMAGHDVSSELEELKLKLAELESALEDNNKMLNDKVKRLKENELLIEEMDYNIQYLQNSLSAIKKSASHLSSSGKRIREMEEEVQHLSAESRKNNFDLYNLELDAYDAEQRLKSLTVQVRRMESIVTEQWIQIREMEQALHLTMIRTSKVTREESTKTFLEYVRGWCKHPLPTATDFPRFCFSKEGTSIVRSYLSSAFHRFKTILSIIQDCHHKLQYYVKQTLESNESTKNLANNEFVFFLASAVIVLTLTIAILLITIQQ